jgi:ABC-type transport system involved in multi-copper enzyme maturation permease subunit
VEEKILLKIEELEKKTEMLLRSAEMMRKYFLWSLIATLLFFLIPLIGLLIAIPYLLSTYGNLYGAL